MGYQTCPNCKGSGKAACPCSSEYNGRPRPGCVICKGTGYGKCFTCEGSGKVYIGTRP